MGFIRHQEIDMGTHAQEFKGPLISHANLYVFRQSCMKKKTSKFSKWAHEACVNIVLMISNNRWYWGKSGGVCFGFQQDHRLVQTRAASIPHMQIQQLRKQNDKWPMGAQPARHQPCMHWPRGSPGVTTWVRQPARKAEAQAKAETSSSSRTISTNKWGNRTMTEMRVS